MSLLSKYLNHTKFSSYEDFYANCRLQIPEHFNFAFDVMDYYAEHEPSRKALVWCDDTTEDLTITFAELQRRCNKVANLLKAHGIGRGDCVMLAMKSRHEFWPAIMACHKLEAISIPATHMLKEHDVTYRIEQARIKAILAANSSDLLEQIDLAHKATGDIVKCKICVGCHRAGWLNYDEAVSAMSDQFQTIPEAERNFSTAPMLMYFTSGTSGFPKMVLHNHIYALGHIFTAAFWQNVHEGELHYTVADTGWGKAVWGKLYGQWIAGAVVFVYDYEKFNAHNMLEKIQRYHVKTFCAPPTVYRFLIKEDLSQYDLSSLEYACTAGEPLNPEVYVRFEEKTGLKLREAYGQTELVVTTATWPWMTPKPGSMGKPTPGYDLVLLDSDGNPVEIGEEGEMCLRTPEGQLPPGLFMEYHNAPDMTASAWHDGFYHTGDVAWKDQDGFLWFVGRADDVIKSSGYRIGPFEVESVLMQHPAVLECAITGVPDPVRGQIVKATIVLAKGHTPSEELKKEIQQFVKDNTAPYKYPRAIDFVDEMPKTISGKIRRTALRNST